MSITLFYVGLGGPRLTIGLANTKRATFYETRRGGRAAIARRVRRDFLTGGAHVTGPRVGDADSPDVV